MAESKHRRKGVRRSRNRVMVGGRTVSFSEDFRNRPHIPGTIAPTEEDLIAAFAEIPDDLSWDWAAPRLTPVFERARADGLDGDPTLNVVTPLGVAVGFGIEIGMSFARVTRSMAERWEVSLDQLEDAAFRHLADATAQVTKRDLQHIVHRGHMVRCLPEPGGWASSVILAGDEVVTRIFGPDDQIFTAPSRGQLLSFEGRTPDMVVAEVTSMLEQPDPDALLLSPFALLDGHVSWLGVSSPEPFD